MLREVNQNVLTILLFEALLGTGTMEWIPTWTAEFKSAVWILIALYTLLLLGIGLLIVHLSQYMPSDFTGCTMFDYFLGRKLGGVLNLLLLGFLLICAGKALLLGTSLIHYTTLPYTPTIALVLFAMLTPAQIFYAGFDSLLRFQTVLFVPALILAVVLLLLCFRTADFSNLLPVTPRPSMLTADSLTKVMELLQGLILFVIYIPLFKRFGMSVTLTKRSFTYAGFGIIMLNVLNLLVVLTVLGPFEASSTQWPVIEVVRIQKMTGPLLERLDLIFLLPVLIAVISAVNLYSYGAHHVMSYYTHPSQWVRLIWVFGLILLIVAIPNNQQVAYSVYGTIIKSFELMFFCLIPVMWLIRRMAAKERRIFK
ncbi:GerAB/ArcD/ProY family transporter [Alicyclobacillus fodiniaquatilis]|uniref:GerAB/ArcD/ProY family transporter n=1 Tax=Alicyclobacillus fodiniaquatilis TaxID=1661150 RepID=A0ABW4JBS0_9BACL